MLSVKTVILHRKTLVYTGMLIFCFFCFCVDCIKQLLDQIQQAVNLETMADTSLTEMLLSLQPTVIVLFLSRSNVLKTIKNCKSVSVH